MLLPADAAGSTRRRASGVAPVLALGGAAALVVLGLVLADATPAGGARRGVPVGRRAALPVETVSLIKMLGALLFVGYLLRALARPEPSSVPPTLCRW